MQRLSPCSDELICSEIAEFAPNVNRVLDVGCGRGGRMNAIKERFPESEVFGVDSDEDMVNFARSAGNVYHAKAENLPFEDKSFSLALCECSLSLFDDVQKALEEMARVLETGGILLLGELFAPEADGDFVSAPDGNAVRRIYSRKMIERLAHNAGFGELKFSDRSEDLAAMAAQMLLDGSFCDCVGTETALLLRRIKARYGLWIFKKEEKALPIAGLISAAGLSSRMGAFKPLLPFGEGTIISRCVENMRCAGAESVLIVTGHRAEEIKAQSALDGCGFVHNAGYSKNQMFDSLCIGLRALEGKCSKVIISPVDVPAVKAETVKALLAEKADVVRPLYEGKSGHPIVLDARRITDVLSYSGEGGLRGAIEKLGLEVREIECDDAGCCIDADRPEDYELLKKLGEKQ